MPKLVSHIDIDNCHYTFDLSNGIDISIDFISDSDGPNCFYAPKFKTYPLVSGEFIGAIEDGSPVNFYNVHINPHGNGTHTECVGHISNEKVYINEVCPKGILPAQLMTVKPSTKGDDFVIKKNDLSEISPDVKILIIRTLPNPISKTAQVYSGENPIYFSPKAIQHIVNAGIQHLIVDLPSIDREEDGGALASHKAFWDYPNTLDKIKTITEMVFVPDEIKDNFYLCTINAVNFKLDAAPSRILLYPIIKLEDDA
jgi:kynurenine formamidase